MNTTLETRIKLSFPFGNDWERDDSQLEANNYAERILNVLEKCCDNLPLVVKASRWSGCHCDELIFTHVDYPDFYSWGKMSNQEKIQWCREMRAPYVVLWVKVSRVADYYVSHFNHWHPQGDSEHIKVDCHQVPDEKWKGYLTGVYKIFHEQGFLLASRRLLNEHVPFVLTWGGKEVPADDPRWDDDDFEPDPVPAVIYDCLFGDE